MRNFGLAGLLYYFIFVFIKILDYHKNQAHQYYQESNVFISHLKILVIIIISVQLHMQGTNEYHYDFSYSVAFENLSMEHFEGVDDLEKDFYQWYEILSTMHVIAQSETSRSNNLLFKIPVFRKLGLQLFGLCVCSQKEIGLQQKNNQIQKYRESIYICLQQLEQILGKEKSKYLNIIIVCLYAITQRTLQDIFNIDDEFLLFHTIYWELKGQLTNKQTMESLLMKIFNIEEFHKFMYWSKDDLVAKYLKSTPQTISIAQPLTFRATNTQKNNVLYQSFRQISMSRSNANIKMERQQNQQINRPKQERQVLKQRQPIKQRETIDRNSKLNMDIFRKKPQYSTTQEGQRPLYKAKQNEGFGVYGNPNVKIEERIFANKIQNLKNNKFGNFNPSAYKSPRLDQHSQYQIRH